MTLHLGLTSFRALPKHRHSCLRQQCLGSQRLLKSEMSAHSSWLVLSCPLMKGDFSESTQMLQRSPTRKRTALASVQGSSTAHSSKAALARSHSLIAGTSSEYIKEELQESWCVVGSPTPILQLSFFRTTQKPRVRLLNSPHPDTEVP